MKRFLDMDLVAVLNQQCFTLACMLREEEHLKDTAPFYNNDTVHLSITRIKGKTMRLPINLISLQYKACKKCYPTPLEFKADFHTIFKRYFEIADRTERHYWDVIATENRYTLMLASIESEFRHRCPAYRISPTYQAFEIDFDVLDDVLKLYIGSDDVTAEAAVPNAHEHSMSRVPQTGIQSGDMLSELNEPLNLVLSEEERAKRKRAKEAGNDVPAQRFIKNKPPDDSLRSAQYSGYDTCVEQVPLKRLKLGIDSGLVKNLEHAFQAEKASEDALDKLLLNFPPGCVIDAEVATTSKGFLSGQYCPELDMELMGNNNNSMPLNLSKLSYKEIDDYISTDYDADDDDDNDSTDNDSTDDDDEDYDNMICPRVGLTSTITFS